MKKFIKSSVVALIGVALFSTGIEAQEPGEFSLRSKSAHNPDISSIRGIAGAVNDNLPYKSGEVLVEFRQNTGTVRAQSVIERNGARIGRVIRGGNRMYHQVHISRGQSVSEAVERFRRDPMVVNAQPNYIYRLKAAPNDTNYGMLWGMKNTGQTVNGTAGTSGVDIDVETAWNTITDCSSVVVAVVDSGINYNHEDLSGNLWNNSDEIGGNGTDDDGNGYVDDTMGWDAVESDNDPMDLNGHGTHVAGIIGGTGNNTTGVTGVCWNVKLMPIRVLDSGGTGTSLSISEGYDYAAANGAHIINASLGGSSDDSVISNAISGARTSGVLIVAAAGNDGTDNDSTPVYPASYDYDNIVSVAAIDQDGALASFSNYGATSVDIAAPGVNILSSYINPTVVYEGTGSYGSWSMSGGWAKDTTGTCSYWVTQGRSSTTIISNPSTWCSGGSNYLSSADDTVWAYYSMSGLSSYDALFAVVPVSRRVEDGYDFFGMGYKAGVANPFGGTGVEHWYTGYTFAFAGDPKTGWVESILDISDCKNSTYCSIGFNLDSDYMITDQGVGVDEFDLYGVTQDDTFYDYLDGTSMATPYVAGIAALTKARNPDFNYVDLVNAIAFGGVADAGLSGVVSTGARATASGAIKYIPQTEGVSFSVP